MPSRGGKAESLRFLRPRKTLAISVPIDFWYLTVLRYRALSRSCAAASVYYQ